MHIQVRNLQGRPRSIKLREPVENFPALDALAEQGDVVFKGTVDASLNVSLVDDLVRVEGQVAATVILTCSRCLEPVERPVNIALSLCYSELARLESDDEAEEVELTLDELNLTPFQGDEIDPGPEIAQELIMALPQSVLCRDDCAGLCPVCGIDLNKNTCRCQPPVFHEGLARLKDFKVERD